MKSGVKDKKKEANKPLIILLGAGICLIFIVALVLSSFAYPKEKVNEKVNLEEKMTAMVSSFYEKNIKGKVIGVHRQIVTLEDLQKQDYDISVFIKSSCKLESFSYVILEDAQETDVAKIKYTVENHLDCQK